MFDVSTSKGYDAGKMKFVRKSTNRFEFVGRTKDNYGVQGFVEKLNVQPNDAGTISVSQVGAVHAQIRKNKWYSSQNIFVLSPNYKELINLLVVAAIDKILVNYGGYSSYPTLQTLKEHKIQLPTKDGKIDFEFMDACIRELSAYLTVSGLDNYELSSEEKEALENLKFVQWKEYNLEKLFGKSTRGKRLKSDDRVSGSLPFITAGEANTGISDFIGNEVEVFSKNTITIDMFGSAKYRNYNYGGDDHIAVVHTEKIKPESAIFVTSAIHKSSYNGQFNYGHNFYAKDADALNIMLPTKDEKIDFSYMELLISAVQKLVIKDVVLYADEKIQSTKKIVKES